MFFKGIIKESYDTFSGKYCGSSTTYPSVKKNHLCLEVDGPKTGSTPINGKGAREKERGRNGQTDRQTFYILNISLRLTIPQYLGREALWR